MKKVETKLQLDKALEKSNHEPIIIFKHSNTCPISAGAYEEMIEFEKKIELPIFIVVVQEARDVSNQIQDILEVEHQSPQAILVSQSHEKKVFNHDEITEDDLFEAVMNF